MIYKIINIAVVESTENVYHVTRKKFIFTHAPFNKNKEIKNGN